MTHFILMLTKDDRTVAGARKVYEQVRAAPVSLVGFKDVGASAEELKELAALIRRDGRHSLLEVVSTDREGELRSIAAALDIGVDYVLGGRHADEALRLLKGGNVRYFPFCGVTVGHPTRLTGTIQEIVDDARRLAALPGVHGLDLLGYRFDGDVERLTREVVRAAGVPVIAAGSIDSPQRIRAMCEAGVWGFTIGSALFDGRFMPDLLPQQIRSVLQIQGVSP
jgi:hypothetical protein